ncbi:MAG: hypothetical protein KDI98_06820 [Hyphomicrobiaceae bacterium]|nr:hypothetical protein [Hyphomicrobiaceae bacterium]
MIAASPQLSKLAQLWERAEKALGRWPGIEEIGAGDLALAYPGYFIVGRLKDAPETAYVYLETGPDLPRQLGQSVKGKRFDEVLVAPALASIQEAYKSTLARGAPHIWECTNLVNNERMRRYRRLALPITDTRGDGRCILAVAEWLS